MLGITPPAVSQYVSKKRGYNIEFREDIREAIGKLADDLIAKKVDNLVARICEICRMLQDDEDGLQLGQVSRKVKSAVKNLFDENPDILPGGLSLIRGFFRQGY